jgi:hypothetical protein
VAFVIVLVSAVYVVVDLARWEWNRAVLAALMCLAALVVFSTTLILGQLTRIDQRLDEVARRSDDVQQFGGRVGQSVGFDQRGQARHRRRSIREEAGRGDGGGWQRPPAGVPPGWSRPPGRRALGCSAKCLSDCLD